MNLQEGGLDLSDVSNQRQVHGQRASVYWPFLLILVVFLLFKRVICFGFVRCIKSNMQSFRWLLDFALKSKWEGGTYRTSHSSNPAHIVSGEVSTIHDSFEYRDGSPGRAKARWYCFFEFCVRKNLILVPISLYSCYSEGSVSGCGCLNLRYYRKRCAFLGQPRLVPLVVRLEVPNPDPWASHSFREVHFKFQLK